MISNDLVYGLLLLFGAFAVGVHAYALYATPLSNGESTDDQRISAVLDCVSLNWLGGPRSYTAGLLCYLGINEFLYLILSSSSVILELSLSVISGEHSVGAMSLDGSELNPLTPVLASSVIMTIGQISPFSQVENAIRRIAHHVAGIPSNVYETVNRINAFEFADERIDTTSDAVIEARRLAKDLRSAAIDDGLDEKQADDLSRDVMHVVSVRHWIYGADGARLWSSRNLRALRQAIALVRPRTEILEDRLRSLTDTSASVTNMERQPRQTLSDWLALLRDCADVRRELNELLAVLIINQPGARAANRASQINRLLHNARQRKQSHEINALFGASLFGLALAFAAVFTYYLSTGMLRDMFNWLLFELQPWPNTTNTESGLWVHLFDSVRRSIDFAFRDILNFGLIFTVSAAVALSVRSTRLASNSWTVWSGRHNPFQQYFSVAVMGCVIAYLFYTLSTFYQLVISPSLSLDGKWLSPALLNDFRAQYADYLLIPMTGLVCAWLVCLLSDRETTRWETDLATPGNAHRNAHRTKCEAESGAESGVGRQPWWDKAIAVLAFRSALICGSFHMFMRIYNGSVTEPFQVTETLMVPILLFFSCIYAYGILYRRSTCAASQAPAGIDTQARTLVDFPATPAGAETGSAG